MADEAFRRLGREGGREREGERGGEEREGGGGGEERREEEVVRRGRGRERVKLTVLSSVYRSVSISGPPRFRRVVTCSQANLASAGTSCSGKDSACFRASSILDLSRHCGACVVCVCE